MPSDKNFEADQSDFASGYELGYRAGIEQQVLVNNSLVVVMTIIGLCVGLVF
jgi:hypothetical protein